MNLPAFATAGNAAVAVPVAAAVTAPVYVAVPADPDAADPTAHADLEWLALYVLDQDEDGQIVEIIRVDPGRGVHRVTDEARRIMFARYSEVYWPQPLEDWPTAHPLIEAEVEDLRDAAGEAQRPDMLIGTVPL